MNLIPGNKNLISYFFEIFRNTLWYCEGYLWDWAQENVNIFYSVNSNLEAFGQWVKTFFNLVFVSSFQNQI